MLFNSTQQLDFLAQFLPLDEEPLTVVSSQDYLGIFERSSPHDFQIDRWLLIENSCFYSLIKFRGRRKFIKDYLQGKEAFYDLENWLYEAENSSETHPDELTHLCHQCQVQEDWNESLFQLLLSHNQMPLMLDLIQLFEEFSYLTSDTSDKFNFAAHSKFDWDAIALDYIFDSQKIYGTTLTDLFAPELTPNLARIESSSEEIFQSYYSNFDLTYQFVNGWKYAILGRRTVYQLPSPLSEANPNPSAVVCPTTPSSFLSLSSSELKQCRSPYAES